MQPHWFWWLLLITCLLWYSTITIYVAIKGATDIKRMLARLDQLRDDPPTPGPPSQAP